MRGALVDRSVCTWGKVTEYKIQGLLVKACASEMRNPAVQPLDMIGLGECMSVAVHKMFTV